MHRFYIPGKISGGTITIRDVKQVHHLRDVLRLKAGDEVQVFDEAGKEFPTTIAEIGSRQAVLTLNSRAQLRIKKTRIAIACAIPKKSIMDDIVDKLTQLDVDTIIPLVTERVVVNVVDKADLRLERWRKIAVSAAQQSQRNSLPVIAPITGFNEGIVQAGGYDLRLIATTVGEPKAIKGIFAGFSPSSVFVLVGPEGDFTAKEVKQAISAGFVPVSLGDTILRVETAAIAVASYIRLAL